MRAQWRWVRWYVAAAVVIAVAACWVLFGLRLVVMDSDAMSQTVSRGTLMVTHRVAADSLEPGDIVSIDLPSGDVATRRVEAVDVTGQTPRVSVSADGNSDQMSFMTDEVAVALVSIPALGGILVGWGLTIVLAIALVVLCVVGWRYFRSGNNAGGKSRTRASHGPAARRARSPKPAAQERSLESEPESEFDAEPEAAGLDDSSSESDAATDVPSPASTSSVNSGGDRDELIDRLIASAMAADSAPISSPEPKLPDDFEVPEYDLPELPTWKTTLPSETEKGLLERTSADEPALPLSQWSSSSESLASSDPDAWEPVLPYAPPTPAGSIADPVDANPVAAAVDTTSASDAAVDDVTRRLDELMARLRQPLSALGDAPLEDSHSGSASSASFSQDALSQDSLAPKGFGSSGSLGVGAADPLSSPVDDEWKMPSWRDAIDRPNQGRHRTTSEGSDHDA